MFYSREIRIQLAESNFSYVLFFSNSTLCYETSFLGTAESYTTVCSNLEYKGAVPSPRGGALEGISPQTQLQDLPN